MSSKLFTSLSVTIIPIFLTKNLLFWISTYPRSWIVEIIFAYVEGRPIPFFSNSLTKAASENLAGGLVYFCLFSRSLRLKFWFTASGGKILESWSSDFDLTILVKPSKTTSLPVAEKIYSSNCIFALVAKYSASGNCEPINCCQINSYNLFSSSDDEIKPSDLVDAFVGLIASWASCAFSLEEYILGALVRYLSPRLVSTYILASAIDSGDRAGASVLI